MSAVGKRNPVSIYKSITVWSVAVSVLFLLIWSAGGTAESFVKIGVRAHSGVEEARNRWSATADYLTDAVAGHRFRMVPMVNFEEMEKAVQKKEIDFVLTNPAAYVELEAKFGITRIATLINLHMGKAVSEFGGVIFTRADRADIQTLQDVRSKSITGVNEKALGGWLAALRELKDAGVNPYKDCSKVEFGMTQEPVVFAVRNGKTDIGTVRTGILEELAKKGVIDIKEFKIIHRINDDFPFLHSTRLYPEWPFAQSPHVPEALSKSVAIALLRLDEKSKAAEQGGYKGWTVPLDYTKIHALMKELEVGPYMVHAEFSLIDVLYRYWHLFLMSLFILIGCLGFALYVQRNNKKLRNSREELKKTQDSLELLVEERTAELKASEEYLEYFRFTIEHAKDAVYWLNSEGGFNYVNEQACKSLGYTREELMNLHLWDIDPNFPEDIWAKTWEKTAKSGRRLFETQHRKKDGVLFPVEVMVSHVERGDKEHHVAFVRDITARKLAEQKIKEDEAKLKEVQEMAHMGYWKWNVMSGEVEWSDEVYKIFHLDPQEFTPHIDSIMALSPWPGDSERHKEIVQRAIEKREQGTFEQRFLRPDGSIGYYFSTFRGEFNDQGELVAMMGTVQDITEQKRMQEEKDKLEKQLQQSQKMEAIGTLAGGIAHDFNNILSIIFGFTDLALADARDPMMVKNLENIYTASLRAKELVKQILAFSRQTEAEKIPLKLQHLVKESVRMLRSSIPTTIEIQQKIDVQSDTIIADPTRFQQVLMNLCMNAFHAMEETGGTLKIALGNVELTENDIRPGEHVRPGRFVKLEVTDSGPGISPEIQERMFEPYFTTKSLGKGTGLGLAVVHGIVSEHGGVVRVHSEMGKGASFQVYFPAAGDVAISEEPSAGEIPKGNERILLVDDDKTVLEIGRLMLTQLGYKVVARNSSLDALEIFKKQPDQFDLLITDQTMPAMTGVELAKAVLAVRQGLPVILSTGYSSIISEESAKKIGITEFVMKPFTAGEISKRIRKALDVTKKA